jgi:hypothetical protein
MGHLAAISMSLSRCASVSASPIDFFAGILPTQKIMDTDRDTNLLFKYFAKIKNPNDRLLVVQIAKKLSSS